MNTCRDMREMVLTKRFCCLIEIASEMILRFANLDLVFCRKVIDFQMYSRMLHETWTHVVFSDDEYFFDDWMTVFPALLPSSGDERDTPFQLLSTNPGHERQLRRQANFAWRQSLRMNPAPEIYEGLTAFVQRKDYILVRWEARMQNAVAFLECEFTGKRLSRASLHANWVRYKYRGAYWWLENFPVQRNLVPKRWFWSKEIISREVDGEHFVWETGLGKPGVCRRVCRERFPPLLAASQRQ